MPKNRPCRNRLLARARQLEPRSLPVPIEVRAPLPCLIAVHRAGNVLTFWPTHPTPPQAEGELYAQVRSVLGGDRFSVTCADGLPRTMVMLRQDRRRRDMSCRPGDLVLVQRVLLASDDRVCHMRARLTLAEGREVRAAGTIPAAWVVSSLTEEEQEAARWQSEGDCLCAWLPVDNNNPHNCGFYAAAEAAAAEVEVNLDDL
jgi:translation initiation factor IF-1